MTEPRLIAERIPFLMNLGQPDEVIGLTDVWRMSDGNIKLETRLGPRGSELVDHFNEIADIKDIGFAGVLRKGANAQPAIHSGSAEGTKRSEGSAER